MHYNMFQREPLFRDLKQKNKFLAWFGNRLRVWFVLNGTFLYEQGDDINQFAIIQSGTAAFVSPKYGNSIFSQVEALEEDNE